MQIRLQPYSNYLSSIVEKCTRAVLATETVQEPCNIGCGSSARKMEMMKLETYSLRRGTMGVAVRAVRRWLERIEVLYGERKKKTKKTKKKRK